MTAQTPDGTPHGLTVNSFASISLEPPLVSVCIDRRSRVLPPLLAATHFGVSVLSEIQRDVSERFAGNRDARFDGIAFQPGQTGVPLLEGALCWMECARQSHLDAGDHVILLGKVEHAQTFPGQPLLYFASRYCCVAEMARP